METRKKDDIGAAASEPSSNRAPSICWAAGHTAYRTTKYSLKGINRPDDYTCGTPTMVQKYISFNYRISAGKQLRVLVNYTPFFRKTAES